MTYATKQLTEALQELTNRRCEFEAKPEQNPPALIATRELVFSKEIENFLEEKRAYAEKTRSVSVGTY